MSFPRSKPEDGIVQQFEREFALEIIKSDRLRVTILMCVLAAALVVVPVLSLFSSTSFESAFHGRFKSFMLLFFVIMLVVLGSLAIERVALGRLIRQQKRSV